MSGDQLLPRRIRSISQILDGSGADGYVCFHTTSSTIGGDNDLFWDRENNKLQTKHIQSTNTDPLLLGTTGSSARGLGGDDVVVGGELEVRGIIYPATTIRFLDGQSVIFGNSLDTSINYGTQQTAPALIINVSAESNTAILNAKANSTNDFMLPAQDDPTLCIQSAQTAGHMRLCLAHNRTDGYISSELGGLQLAANSSKIRLTNSAGDTFDMLQFGGTSASFAGIKYDSSTLGLRIRKCDDSADAQLNCAGMVASNVQTDSTGYFRFGSARTRLYSDASGDLRLTDNTETTFGSLKLGGLTALYPAIKKLDDKISIRTAVDGYGVLNTGGFEGNYTEVSDATYTTLKTDYIIGVMRTKDGECTITLGSDCNYPGHIISVVDSAGNASNQTITIDTEGTEQINGLGSVTITGDYDSYKFVSTGNDWIVLCGTIPEE